MYSVVYPVKNINDLEDVYGVCFGLNLMCNLIKLFVELIRIYRSNILISRNNFVYNV